VNIIEAIKSGRRFKRTSSATFCLSSDMLIADGYYRIRTDYLLADDWEVEEVSCYVGSAMITREQFDKAWSKLWPYDPYGDGLNSINCYTKLERDALAKELGL